MKRYTLFGKWVLLVGVVVPWAAPSWAEPPRPATNQEIKDMIAAAGEAIDFGSLFLSMSFFLVLAALPYAFATAGQTVKARRRGGPPQYVGRA